MAIYVDNQVKFQTLLAILNLFILYFQDVFVLLIALLDRQTTQVALSFSSILKLLDSIRGEWIRSKIRKSDLKFTLYGHIELSPPRNNSNTNNVGTTPNNSHQQHEINPQSLLKKSSSANKPITITLATLIFLLSYSYHPISLGLSYVSNPIQVPILTSINSTTSDETISKDNFNNQRYAPLYSLSVDHNLADNLYLQPEIRFRFNETVLNSTSQIMGSTFYQNENISCHLDDTFSQFFLQTHILYQEYLDLTPIAPKIECYSLGLNSADKTIIRSEDLVYKFDNDNGHNGTSYKVGSNIIPKVGDNFTVFSLSPKNDDDDTVNLKATTIIYTDFYSKQNTSKDTTVIEKVFENAVQSFENQTEGVIYGAFNDEFLEDKYSSISQENFFSKVNDSIHKGNNFSTVATFMDTQQNIIDPNYDHYVRFTILVGAMDDISRKYSQIGVSIMKYKTRTVSFSVPQGNNNESNDNGGIDFNMVTTNLNRYNSTTIISGNFLVVPIWFNIKVVPTVDTIFESFISSDSTLNLVNGHTVYYFNDFKLHYDVTVLVILIGLLGGLSIFFTILLKILYRMSIARPMAREYDLLRDYFEQPGECTKSLISIVQPSYLGNSRVDLKEVNHIGMLDKVSAKLKPRPDLKYD